MKRVTISEDGLMAVVDENSQWMHGDLTSEVTGDYTIDADSVKRLMAIMTEESTMRIYEKYGSIFDRKYEVITGDSHVIEKLEELAEAEAEKRRLKAEAEKKNVDYFSRYCHLCNKIADFNATRRWWERKFKMPQE